MRKYRATATSSRAALEQRLEIGTGALCLGARYLIAEEIQKLQEASFIREVYYPDWLANVVMVKKASEKWQMCVDFTDLNKACPKDSYPLPRVDVLVDSTARH